MLRTACAVHEGAGPSGSTISQADTVTPRQSLASPSQPQLQQQPQPQPQQLLLPNPSLEHGTDGLQSPVTHELGSDQQDPGSLPQPPSSVQPEISVSLDEQEVRQASEVADHADQLAATQQQTSWHALPPKPRQAKSSQQQAAGSAQPDPNSAKHPSDKAQQLQQRMFALPLSESSSSQGMSLQLTPPQNQARFRRVIWLNWQEACPASRGGRSVVSL